MQGWVRNSLRIVVGAFTVYACAGKSISRSDGNSGGSTGDDGTPGIGGISNGGGVGKGGTVGKGGSPGTGGIVGTGGTVGKGGFPGKGGVGGTSGRGGTSGTGNVAGEDSGGADGCGPRRGGGVDGSCSAPPGCISMSSPRIDHVSRNEPSPDDGGGLGGESGAGGDSGGDPDGMATARLCVVPNGAPTQGFLAVNYFMPPGGVGTRGFALYSGTAPCDGYAIGSVTFNDFNAPAPGTWTTQCVAVTQTDLEFTVTVGVPFVSPPYAGVRNLRFVTSCACPRQITRYTTCGDITSPRLCQ